MNTFSIKQYISYKIRLVLVRKKMKWVREKIVWSLLVTALFVMPLSLSENAVTKVKITNFGDTITIDSTHLNGGWLEEREGVRILHLNGSYYDMGYQHGALLSDEIQENLRAQLPYFEDHGFPYDNILNTWHIMDDYLPDEYKEEMRGLADGSGLSFDEIAVLNTMPALFNHMFSCCEISIWGDATTDGKLYHARSLDWSLTVPDPETGVNLHENIVLFVRNPEYGHGSVYPDCAGYITAWSGVNEQGIVVGEDSCITADTTFNGICPAFRMRMVLDCADTAEEAIDILVSNRTCGTNFVLSDAKIPIGYAFDQTANISYVGTWDDPVEGTSPFWQVRHVVRRTPQFIAPECAAVEIGRLRYDPSGLRGFLEALTGKSFMFVDWTHYRALSEQIEKYYGTLDLNSTMMALREEYTGKSDFLMNLALALGAYQTMAQFVVCPETGGMLISFASKDEKACYNPVHYFNLYELLEAEPP